MLSDLWVELWSFFSLAAIRLLCVEPHVSMSVDGLSRWQRSANCWCRYGQHGCWQDC